MRKVKSHGLDAFRRDGLDRHIDAAVIPAHTRFRHADRV